MASPNLEDLFDDSRITQWDWTLLFLVFYTPIGIVLLLVRIFALIQFYLMFLYMPYHPIRKYLLKIFGAVLGVFVNEKQCSKARVNESALWVSNHVSPFDWLVLQVVADKKRLVSFPEGETTTGRRGLLKFQHRSIEEHRRTNIGSPVQPIALKISRPFPSFSVTTLDTPVWTDIFFLLFSPSTTFNIKFLEPVHFREDEDLETCISHLETAISSELGVQLTPFTAKDKEELVKRRRFQEQQQHLPRPNPVSNRLQAMASQVKEVLPHVPMATILSDLSRTNSVDATVANLVEGVVPFTPEPIVSAPPSPPITPTHQQSRGEQSQPSASPPSSSSPMQPFSASSFGRSMNERGLSLQERKQKLLREARLRYCERHGLQIAGINC